MRVPRWRLGLYVAVLVVLALTIASVVAFTSVEGSPSGAPQEALAWRCPNGTTMVPASWNPSVDVNGSGQICVKYVDDQKTKPSGM